MSRGAAEESFAASRLIHPELQPTASGRDYTLPPLRG